MAENDGAREGAHYDEIADDYARHWAPVIRPAALRVVDLLATRLGRAAATAADPAPARVLDVGTGTGTLAIAVLGRWTSARVAGIDASAEMVERARRGAVAAQDGATERLELIVAPADRLPFQDGDFDAAVSSFVLQLVPNRAAALREVRRVLRGGGTFVYATWLRESRELAGADRILEEVLAEFGFDPPDPDDSRGDATSPAAAAAELRRIGFRNVHATRAEVHHRWTPRSYAAFAEHFAESSLFADLVGRERRALRRRLIEALSKAPPGDLELRLPIVYVEGTRIP